ncbi:MAG TPA: MarR family winged helix-turn-helix transcriptional regulator [Burkholderiaceae bacterium]|jgi:DNA-binding MarR family transcriptional regulator
MMANKQVGTVAMQPGEEEGLSQRLDTLKKLRIVFRAAQRHSLWIEKQCGVSGAQLWMMQELHDQPGMRVGELASKLAIHQTTASNLLDALRKRGYVLKERDGNDQRVVNLKLSEQGREALLKAPTPARGLLQEAILQLDESQLIQLDAGLQGLLNSIDKLDEGFGMLPLPFML